MEVHVIYAIQVSKKLQQIASKRSSSFSLGKLCTDSISSYSNSINFINVTKIFHVMV